MRSAREYGESKMMPPNNGCFKDFGSKKECKDCPVRSSCEREYNKIVRRTKEWDYKEYRKALDEKFKLENLNVELFREQVQYKKKVLSLGHDMEKNKKKIFELNNEARKIMGYGTIAEFKELEKEIEVEK